MFNVQKLRLSKYEKGKKYARKRFPLFIIKKLNQNKKRH